MESIRPLLEYGGEDGRSMEANNTSCFNSRFVLDTNRLSLHSLGAAIDINPVQNPIVRDGTHMPLAGKEYLDRTLMRPGMLNSESKAVRIFEQSGWKWAGNWDQPKDYHHFYKDSE